MFKPSKLRTEPSVEYRVAPIQGQPPASAHDSFREALISLLTEVGATANRLKAASARELPAGAGSILQILERHGSQTVPQIARKRVTSRQNIQILVNRLAREGLIEFADNPAHKKSVLVSLTPKGTEILEQTGERRQTFLDGLAQEVAEEDLVAGAMLLRKIREAILESSIASHAPEETIRPPRKTKQTREPKQEDAKADTVHESDFPFNLL